jgi:hypothetical protein
MCTYVLNLTARVMIHRIYFYFTLLFKILEVAWFAPLHYPKKVVLARRACIVVAVLKLKTSHR